MRIQLPEALNTNYIEKFNKETKNQQQLPMLREWAYDFQNNELLLDKNGLPYLVEGNEALKIWVYWAITTEKKAWHANSRIYGAELEHMIGLSVADAIKASEIKRTITEALEQCPYIKSVKQINLNTVVDELTIDVELESIYTDKVVNMSVKV